MIPNLSIKHDASIDIALGRSRKETNWKNREMQWSDLVKKLSVTHRTAESYNEYLSSKKVRQDEIKDIGGFVGGYLSSGRRKSGSVVHRQLVTLDIDFAKGNMWEDFTFLYDNAAVIYSTHKHHPDNPRLRLILPLDRPVFSDEYMAISRKIAGIIGIDYFDHTTFEPSRLMYWPSTSKDGEFEFQFQDGPWLSADSVLSSYRDWKDASEWPVSDRGNAVLRKAMQKQGDPLEKMGIVGAFCRTFTISEAIDKYLSDVYDSCDVPDRFTFKEGSTSAGLVVYDDKYAYSHHGTDPVSNKLCNAFDLVRLHKFGLQDEDAREDTPINKMPSYLAMMDFATRDPEVRKMVITEKLDNAKDDFSGFVPVTEDNDDESWKEKLEVDRKGNVFSTIDNTVIIFENDPYFKGRIGYDDFEKCEVATNDLPWRKITHQTRRLIDRDDAHIRHYLERKYGINSALKVKDAMDILSNKNCFHPVKDYLNSLSWDGASRLDTLFVDYQGAADTKYTRIITRKALVAAVARIFRPGIKFDHIVTLVGKQGHKKSTVISKLGSPWFSDSFSFAMLGKKDAFESLQGVWIIEIAELSGMDRNSENAIKAFVTKGEDRYRIAFGRRTEKFPRQCIFFATTNKMDFLHDPTGDRRYWPIQVNVVPSKKDVFKDLTQHEVDQIWAEAVQFYKKGETIFLSHEEEKLASLIQKTHTEEHPWAGLIRQFLSVKVPKDWHKMQVYDRRSWLANEELRPEGTMFRGRICVLEIWNEALQRRETIDEKSAKVIHDIMRNTEGWELEPKTSRYTIYGPQRNGYIRSTVPENLLINSVTNSVTSADIL